MPYYGYFDRIKSNVYYTYYEIRTGYPVIIVHEPLAKEQNRGVLAILYCEVISDSVQERTVQQSAVLLYREYTDRR